MTDVSSANRPPRVFAVLGMHRSGTSCLTGSLQRAGLILGRHHTWNRHNPKGNRENQDVVELHEAVLVDNNGGWDDPPEAVTWSEPHLARARALLAEHADGPNWGFKDPRALLVLDGWKQLTPVECVGIYRHPVSVVESLAGRGGFPRDKALDLWLAYNRRLLAEHDQAPFPVLSFDLGPEEFTTAVNGVIDRLGLRPVPDNDQFFAEELRSNDKYREADVPAEAAEVYGTLRELAMRQPLVPRGGRAEVSNDTQASPVVPAPAPARSRTRVADPFEGPLPLPDLAPALPASGAPVLSIVVVVHRMADQALRTVASLAPGYQRGVESHQYEIVVVENESDHMMSALEVEAVAPNVRYHARAESQPTPVNAVNAGVAASHGELVGLVVDGARMASPGLVAHTLAASQLSAHVAVVVPGYHLGAQLQQLAAADGYDEQVEAELLADIAWPGDGYRLFDVSVLSGTSKGGFFRPFAESNFLCLPRAIWDELGGMDHRFSSVGGGFANMDLYRRVLDHESIVAVMLPGEGTFHQFHGGATTGGTVAEQRDAIVASSREEYAELRDQPFGPPRKRFLYLGAIAPQALPFLLHSVDHVVDPR